MKRLLTLMVICCFLVATAGISFASEFSSYGYFRTTVQFQNNQDFNDDSTDETFAAEQRVRQFFEYKSSENLKAVVGFEFDSIWGDNGEDPSYYGIHGDQGDDGKGDLSLKHAYLDFDLPQKDVNFKIGGQYMALPGISYTSPVLGCDAPGIKVNTTINKNLDMNLGWVRAIEDGAAYGGDNLGGRGAEADMLFVTAPYSQDKVSITPWASYAYVGKDAASSYAGYYDFSGNKPSSYSAGRQGFGVMSMGTVLDNSTAKPYTGSLNAYWLGFYTKIDTVENMSLQAEASYGSVSADKNYHDRSGFWFRGLADYTGLDNVTPALFGFYSSGENDDLSDGSETFPYFANDGYTTTETGYVAGFGSNTNLGSYDYALMQYVPHAMWQVGLAAKDFSLMEKCSHTLAVSYMMGTNDEGVVDALQSADDQTTKRMKGEMTTEDSAFEIDFNTTYSIYENLDFLLELGYAQMDMDKSTWKGTSVEDNNYLDDPAYKCVTGIKYSY